MLMHLFISFGTRLEVNYLIQKYDIMHMWVCLSQNVKHLYKI